MGKKKSYSCKKCGKVSNEVCGQRRTCKECHLEDLEEDFRNTIKNGDIYLFRKKFTEISRFTAIQHIRFFTRNKIGNVSDWHSMLKYYNVYESFVNQILEHYKKWRELKNNGHIGGFILTYKYIAQEDTAKIGMRNICKMAGFTPTTHIKQDYFDEMDRLIKELGRFPTQSEIDNGNYSVCGFKGRFSHKDIPGMSGVIYNMYGEQAYNKYKAEEYLRRVVTKPSEYKKIISNEELMDRFNSFVDGYFKECGLLPSHRLFEKECKTATKTYRQRFGKSWSDLLKDKGFTNEQIYANNRSEIQCLDKISKVLDCEYIHQKRFDWLIGANNFPLFLDGYYPKYDLCIEFSGRQHFKYVEGKFGTYESFLNQQENDKIKEKLCKKNCKHFLVIKSSSPWHKEDWLKKQLTKLGIKPN